MAVSPFQIITGPATVYVAPVGTAFPAINTDPPGGNWTALGRTEGGVTVTHNQSTEIVRTDQEIGPLKVFRSEEELHIGFSLVEITLETYAKVLNDATVTDVAPGSGTAGHRSFPMRQGPDVKQLAMLVRGPSPYMDAYLQYEVPVVVHVGEPAPSFVRDDKVMLECDFLAIEDPAATSPSERFGRLRAQDAAPL